jgi:hypothetical protein
MHAKRFGIAATTKGRAQVSGTVIDSSLHSGIAALTSEDTTPELFDSSSAIKQPMHAGLPAGHVIAKKCSVSADCLNHCLLSQVLMCCRCSIQGNTVHSLKEEKLYKPQHAAHCHLSTHRLQDCFQCSSVAGLLGPKNHDVSCHLQQACV